MRNTLSNQFFDVLQQSGFINRHQRDRFAFATGSTGSPDAMHIVFGNIRQIEIHYIGQVININTACCDVGGNQCLQRTLFEIGQRPGSCALAFVAVDGGRFDAILVQLFGEAIGPVLGATEDQHLLPAPRTDQERKQFALA